MEDVQDRNDINTIVRSFYEKVRVDGLLGPVFNRVIDDWEAHLEHLTDFWESNIFMVSKYQGNPIKVHQEVDQSSNHIIEQNYFTQWLKLWFETIDSSYIGDRATLMKNRARNMSTYIYIQIFQGRK